MIGCDIISLEVALGQSNALSERRLNKILTCEEQKYLSKSRHPEHLLWSMWALKESAYKLDFQLRKKRYFAPKYYVCFLENLPEQTGVFSATINTPSGLFSGELNITADYIFAQAFLKGEKSNIQSHCFQLKQETPEYQSKSVRTILKKSIANKYQISTNLVDIRTIDDIPFAQILSTQKVIPISISHHAFWGAYAIGFPK